MAYGRKDYFWGVAPEKSVFGELQNSWIHTGSNDIASTATVTVITYNVPVGYYLEVTGFTLVCSGPGHHHTLIKIDAVTKMITYFDSYMLINFGDQGTLTVEEGKQLTVVITNADLMEHTFTVNGFGCLLQTVT